MKIRCEYCETPVQDADEICCDGKALEVANKEIAGLQFIINRSAELLSKGHRDEVESYLTLAAKERT